MNDIQKKYWESNIMEKRRTYSHPVIKAYVLFKIKVINSIIKIQKSNKLLEVWAGNGFFSYYLDKICSVTATDYAQKMIELNSIVNKMVMNVIDIKFSDNYFDIVFEANLLHHVDDIDKSVAEMKRVAKKYIIIIEPNRNNPFMFLFGLVKRVERRSLKFSLKFLKQKFKKHNLHIVAAFSHGVILPNNPPKFLLPFFKFFDRKIPFLGFYNIVICQK